MKKLISISLAISLFLAMCSTAVAAPYSYWTSGYQKNYTYSYNCSYLYGCNQKPGQSGNQGSQLNKQDFWQQLMDKLNGGSSNNGNTGNTVTKPNTGNNTGNNGNNTGNNGNTVTKPNTGNTGNTGNNNTGNTPADTTNQSYVEQIVTLVNQERAKQGLSPVTLDSKLSAAAQVRAREAAQSFSHTRPNGTKCFTALKEAGVSYRGAGENIAYGQRTPQAVMTDWMNSSGHRANILKASYTKIGVGYTVINGTPYWSQFFTY